MKCHRCDKVITLDEYKKNPLTEAYTGRNFCCQEHWDEHRESEGHI